MAELLPIRNGGHKGLCAWKPHRALLGFSTSCFLFVLSLFICVQPFVTLWTGAHQAPLSMAFSRQVYWSGLPHPPPGNLPDPGIEPTSFMSPALSRGFCTTSTTWDALGTLTGLGRFGEVPVSCNIKHFTQKQSDTYASQYTRNIL